MIYNLDAMEDCTFKRTMLRVIEKAVEKEETEPKHIYSALFRLVRTARACLKADEAIRGLGQSDSVFWKFFGDIADAVFFLLEEKTEQFDQSVSWNLLNDMSLSEEKCTRKLMAEYNRLHREVLKMEDLLK